MSLLDRFKNVLNFGGFPTGGVVKDGSPKRFDEIEIPLSPPGEPIPVLYGTLESKPGQQFLWGGALTVDEARDQLGLPSLDTWKNQYQGNFAAPDQIGLWEGMPIPHPVDRGDPIKVADFGVNRFTTNDQFNQQVLRADILVLHITREECYRLCERLERLGADNALFAHLGQFLFIIPGTAFNRDELMDNSNMMRIIQIHDFRVFDTPQQFKEAFGVEPMGPHIVHEPLPASPIQEILDELNEPAPSGDPETDDVDLDGEFE